MNEPIQNQTYQHLGSKTFKFMVFRRLGIAAFFLLIMLLVVAARNILISVEGSEQYIFIINYLIMGCLALVVLFALIGLLISMLEFAKFKFKLDEDSIKITRGILTTEDIAIPYRRVEAVDIKQTFFFQLFGISRVTIETTSDEDEHAEKSRPDADDEVIPVIDRELALMIQDELTKRANTQKMNIQNSKI